MLPDKLLYSARTRSIVPYSGFLVSAKSTVFNSDHISRCPIAILIEGKGMLYYTRIRGVERIRIGVVLGCVNTPPFLLPVNTSAVVATPL